MNLYRVSAEFVFEGNPDDFLDGLSGFAIDHNAHLELAATFLMDPADVIPGSPLAQDLWGDEDDGA